MTLLIPVQNLVPREQRWLREQSYILSVSKDVFRLDQESEKNNLPLKYI